MRSTPRYVDYLRGKRSDGRWSAPEIDREIAVANAEPSHVPSLERKRHDIVGAASGAA
jgi:hypothetical protein